jgi:methionyl-tRNA formyltransferase
MNIAIIGRTGILYDTAERLFKEGHNIKLIVTAKEAPEYDKTADDFRRFAKRVKAKFVYSPSINSSDNIKIIKKLGGLDLAVSINYVSIISGDLIKLFKHGIINAHMGDLPRYRGNACPNWAILNGEKSVTLSLHLMEPGELDSGAVLLQRKFPLGNTTTITEVYKFFAESAPKMFSFALKGIASGKIKAHPQPRAASLALRCYPRMPVDSLIDWDKDVVYLDRLVRSSTRPFGGAYTYLANKKLIIWKAYPTDYVCPSLAVPGQAVWFSNRKGQVGIACGKGVLALQSVEIGNSKIKRASEVIDSLRIRLGSPLENKIKVLKQRIKHLEIILSKRK